jgi:hypothetical protein
VSYLDSDTSRARSGADGRLFPRDFLDHLHAGKRRLLAQGTGNQFFRMSPDFRHLTTPVWNILKLILFLLHRVRRFNIEEAALKESYPP